jgi:hypothetical protein
MEPSMSDINAKLDLLVGTIGKIHEIDGAVKGLVQENAALRADLAAKDIKIKTLSDQLNRVDQATRSTSLRILGLPVTTQSTQANVISVVYKEILMATLAAAKQSGDIDDHTNLPPHFLIVNAFAIPAKNNASSAPVIVKLHSKFIHALVFKHKKNALPTALDLPSNRVRNKYLVFEDLAPPRTRSSGRSSMTFESRVPGLTEARSGSTSRTAKLSTKSNLCPTPSSR